MKEGAIILGHGSRREEANDEVRKLASDINESTGTPTRAAFMSFGKPALEDVVKEMVAEGADKIIIMPFFLSSGNHLTKDIPKIIQRIEADHPQAKLVLAKHLGFHPGLLEIVKDRIDEAGKL